MDLVRRVANLAVLPLAAFYAHLPRHEHDVSAVAKRTEPLLATSSFTAFIWAVLFSGHILYALYQGLPRQRHRPLHRRIGGHTVANSALIAAWIFAFTSEWFTVAWLILVAMLANLIVMDGLIAKDGAAGKAHWLVRFPYSLNLGWIAMLTVLETTRFLQVVVGYDGSPFAPIVWANALVLLTIALGAFFTIVRTSVPATLAVAWGLLGVAAHASGSATSLAISSASGCAALIGVIALEAFALHHVALKEPPREHRRIHRMHPV